MMFFLCKACILWMNGNSVFNSVRLFMSKKMNDDCYTSLVSALPELIVTFSQGWAACSLLSFNFENNCRHERGRWGQCEKS
jgi:hypothetical protein